MTMLGEKIESRGSRFINKVQTAYGATYFVFSRCYSKDSRKVKSLGKFDTLPAARFAMGVNLKDAMNA